MPEPPILNPGELTSWFTSAWANAPDVVATVMIVEKQNTTKPEIFFGLLPVNAKIKIWIKCGGITSRRNAAPLAKALSIIANGNALIHIRIALNLRRKCLVV